MRIVVAYIPECRLTVSQLAALVESYTDRGFDVFWDGDENAIIAEGSA